MVAGTTGPFTSSAVPHEQGKLLVKRGQARTAWVHVGHGMDAHLASVGARAGIDSVLRGPFWGSTAQAHAVLRQAVRGKGCAAVETAAKRKDALCPQAAKEVEGAQHIPPVGVGRVGGRLPGTGSAFPSPSARRRSVDTAEVRPRARSRTLALLTRLPRYCTDWWLQQRPDWRLFNRKHVAVGAWRAWCCIALSQLMTPCRREWGIDDMRGIASRAHTASTAIAQQQCIVTARGPRWRQTHADATSACARCHSKAPAGCQGATGSRNGTPAPTGNPLSRMLHFFSATPMPYSASKAALACAATAGFTAPDTGSVPRARRKSRM